VRLSIKGRFGVALLPVLIAVALVGAMPGFAAVPQAQTPTTLTKRTDTSSATTPNLTTTSKATRTPNLPPTSTVTPTSPLQNSPPPAAATTSNCAAYAPNLVRNPGFEQVTGSAPPWQALEATTTKVPFWTRTNSTSSPTPEVVVNRLLNGTPMTASEGAQYAALPDVIQTQGLVGELSAATNVGATYSLSAEIATASAPHAATFELRLRKSANGAQSAVVAHASITYAGTWMLITGTVTADAMYDRIVLRFSQQGGDDVIDDVHMCQAATQAWACLPSASSLVQNPGFEQVTGPGHFGSGNFGSVGPYWTATFGPYALQTEVPHWTMADQSAGLPNVDATGPPFGPPTAFQGKHARLEPQPPALPDMGLAGELSATTNVGAVYVLSARITTALLAAHPSTFELRLRNSATGTQSAPAAQALIPPPGTTQWVLLTGVVTANANYNQVVLRYHMNYVPDATGGFVDDVQVCQATAVPHGGTGWWTLWHAVAVAVAFGVLILGGLGGLWRRRGRYRRAHPDEYASATVSSDNHSEG